MSIAQNPAGEWSVLSFDTDRIKKYIFATSKLKEIRGASALLDELNGKIPDIVEEYGRGWEGGPVVYAAGGSCTAIVPHGKAEDIIIQVENLYAARTVTASITGVSFQTDGDTIKNSFGPVMKELGRMLQEKKAAKYFSGAGAIPGYVKFCESCSMHPAETRDKTDGSWLCKSCRIKRRASDERRQNLWIQFSNYLESTLKNNQYSRISSLNEMSEADGYLGFISCDGNNMGKVVESLKKPCQFSSFAKGIDELIKKAAFKAIVDFVKPVRNSTLMPFEIFLIGGDDLELAVPAPVALDVASSICRNFEEGSKNILQRIGIASEPTSLSLGAGVVIGPIKYPFQSFNRLAEQLQRSAKRKCALTGISTGVIDYHVVNGSGFADLEDVRSRQFAYSEAGNVPVRLTMRPYFIRDIEKIIYSRNQLHKLKFPRSRLNKLYEQLFINKQAATLATAMSVARSKPDQADALKAFLKGFDAFLIMPWVRDNDGGYMTPLGDLIEIYDFY